MKQLFLLKIQKHILCLAILLICFEQVPLKFQIPGFGGNYHLLFIAVGMIVWLVESLKYSIGLSKQIKFFLLTYICWQLMTLIVGFISYDYWALIRLDQMEKLSKITSLLRVRGIYIDQGMLIKLWEFIRFFKGLIFELAAGFVLSAWVYHLFADNWRQGFCTIRKYVIILVCMLGIYSLFEIASFHGIEGAKTTLIVLNPYFYDIANAHGWWPPLLLPGQVRSLLPEPSFLGIVAMFCVPFLMSYVLETRKLKYMFLWCYFSIMLFLTNARTAIVPYGGELLLLISSIFLVSKKEYTKYVVILLVLSGMAFFVALELNPTRISGTKGLSCTAYFERNVASLENTNQRSNGARLANFVARINVGMKHPIFGVGAGLAGAYITDNFPSWAADNKEVQTWINYSNADVLKNPYPELSKFSSVVSDTGFVGLFLFLVPFFYILVKVICKWNILLRDSKVICLLIAFAGLFVNLFSNAAYDSCLFIIMGLLLCVVDGAKDDKA